MLPNLRLCYTESINRFQLYLTLFNVCIIGDISLHAPFMFALITGYCVNNMIKEAKQKCVICFVMDMSGKSKALIVPMFRWWYVFLLQGSIIITMLIRFVFVLSVAITRGRLHSYIQWQARSLLRTRISDFRTSKYCLLTCLGHYINVLSQTSSPVLRVWFLITKMK